MVTDHMQSKCFRITTLIILGIIGINLISCSSSQKSSYDITFQSKEHLIEKWEDIFIPDGEVSFKFPDEKMEIYIIGSMVCNKRGDYFILDGKAQKLYMFNKNYEFIKQIGKSGEGPGEYMRLAGIELDNEDNVYLYDVHKMMLHKFSLPEYNFSESVRVPFGYMDFIVGNTNVNNLIGYSKSGEELIHIISQDGKSVEKHFEVDDLFFRTFSSRFNLGRFSIVPGQGFLFTYASEYKVYLFDYNIKIVKTWTAKKYSKFMPEKLYFPKELDPYNYTPKHTKWWDKDPKIAWVIYLDDGFFINVMLQFSEMSGKFFVNLHHMNGNTYAAGIDVPYNGKIIYSDRQYIYVYQAADVDDKNNIIPLKVHRYKFKEPAI